MRSGSTALPMAHGWHKVVGPEQNVVGGHQRRRMAVRGAGVCVGGGGGSPNEPFLVPVADQTPQPRTRDALQGKGPPRWPHKR